jgi:hypothetical protein
MLRMFDRRLIAGVCATQHPYARIAVEHALQALRRRRVSVRNDGETGANAEFMAE